MKAGTQNHVKTKRLKRLLGVPLYRAVGILESLWQLCIECCDEGDVGKFTDDEIADYLEWEGEPSALVRSLVDSGWIDKDPSRRLVIHDWFDHCPEFIWDRIRKRQARAAKSAKGDAPERAETTCAPGEPDATGTEPELAENVPSIPNPTKPNQTGSNQTNPPPKPPDSELEADPCWPAGGDGFAQGWGQVADRLGELGATRWKEAITDAKQCGCTPGHAMEILAYAKKKGYKTGAIIYRLSRARPTLPLDDGWPPLESPDEARQRRSSTSAERERLEEERNAKDAADSAAAAKERERRYGPELDAMDPLEVAEICRPNPAMAAFLKKKDKSPLLRAWLLKQLEERATA